MNQRRRRTRGQEAQSCACSRGENPAESRRAKIDIEANAIESDGRSNASAFECKRPMNIKTGILFVVFCVALASIIVGQRVQIRSVSFEAAQLNRELNDLQERQRV